MKKILFLNLYDDPADGGGAEMTLRHLTGGVAERGLEPVMLATSAGRGLHQIERNGLRIWRAGLRNLYWPGREPRGAAARVLWHTLDSYNPTMQPMLRRVLEIEQPDVVSIHNLPGWSAAAWNTIAEMGIPSVQVLHDSYAICPKSSMFRAGRNCSRQCIDCRLLRLPHRRLSNRVSAVVGVSHYILDRHLQEGYFRHVPIRQVIHNARDALELGVAAPTPPRDPNAPLRIGFIGRLDPTKGVEVLLVAFKQMQVPGVELWIAGNGKADYEQGLRASWGDPRVRFLGRVTPRDFYPQVDVVVVPSLWNDTFPGVVFEALAFGRPVIGSRRGGIPEMIREDENGLLFEPDRPGELLAALLLLAGDPGLRFRLGEAARDSARPFLDRRSWVENYIDLYHQVSGGSHTALARPEDDGRPIVQPDPKRKE